MIYLYGDPHLGHHNILRLANRPFKSVLEMNEALIANYNNMISPADEVYFVGDVAYKCSTAIVLDILDRLKGKKYLIQGNHDRKYLKDDRFVKKFEWVDKRIEMVYSKRLYVIDHYPIHSWNGMFRGSANLHGHCHGKVNNDNIMRLDVGVDNPICSYAPISMERVKNIMDEKWRIIRDKDIKE